MLSITNVKGKPETAQSGLSTSKASSLSTYHIHMYVAIFHYRLHMVFKYLVWCNIREHVLIFISLI